MVRNAPSNRSAHTLPDCKNRSIRERVHDRTRLRRLCHEQLEDRRLLTGFEIAIDDVTALEGDDAMAFADVFAPQPGLTGVLSAAGDFTRGPDGYLYISSRGCNEVLRYNETTGELTGVFVTAGDGGLDGPWGLDFGLDGNLYVASRNTHEVLRYDGQTGQFIDVFIAAGSGGLSSPAGLGFDPGSQYLYVSSLESDEVLRYALSDVHMVDVVVTNTNSGLDRPVGLTFDGVGRLYVTSSNTDEVIRYDPSLDAASVFVSAGDHGLDYPTGLTWDDSGTLYVVGRDSGQVLRYDMTGTFVDVFGESGQVQVRTPLDVLFDTNGDLLVATLWDNAIYRFDGSSGVFIDTLVTSPLVNATHGLAFGPDGNLYVGSYFGGVARFEAESGAYVDMFVPAGTNGLAGALGLTFGPDLGGDGEQDLYVCNDRTEEVLRFSSDGSSEVFISAFSGGLLNPHEIIFDAEGMAYVTSHGTDEVLRYHPDGSFDRVFVSSGSGGLDLPSGLRFHNDMLYVASTATDQILRYDASDGSFVDAFLTGILPDKPEYLIFGTHDNLYVIDQGIDGVRRYNGTTGQYIDVFLPPPSQSVVKPWGMVFDSDDNLYLSSAGDDRGVIRFSPTSSAAFTVTLSNPSDTLVTVDYATLAGTAESGVDFESQTGTLIFEPGVTSRSIIVPTIDDEIQENDETFTVILSNPTGGAAIPSGQEQGTATIIDPETPLFADSFEHGQWDGLWVEDSQNDWFTSTQRKTDGSYSAEVDGSASNATLTVASPIDLTPYASAELTFDWYIESGLDSGEYLALDLFNGVSWVQDVARLRGNVDAENTWQQERIVVDGGYLVSDFQFRFRAKMSGSTEDANVDNVQLIATSLAMPPNADPTADDDAATTDEDVAATIAVLLNDTDSDGDSLIVDSVTQGTLGSVVINGDNTVTYTPGANANGLDSFTYTVSDGNGATDTATVTVTVNPVDDLPVAADDAATTNEDVAIIIPVLDNDLDVDGDALFVDFVTDGTHGAVSINPDNTVTYTPSGDYYGADSFSYSVSDGTTVVSAIVSVTVNEVNDAPVASGDAANTDEDTAVTIDVLANDSDVDDATLSVAAVTQGSHGVVAIVGNQVTYTPVSNFHGSDSFTYTASDGRGGAAVATVDVTVGPVNDAPVANADSYSIDQDTTLTVLAPGVLVNDTDVDGDLLTAAVDAGPTHGLLTLNADGSLEYVPTSLFYGMDSFSYIASDGILDSTPVIVTINVQRVNVPPVAHDDAYGTDEDVSLVIDAGGVLTNDTDAESDPLSAILVDNVSNGTLALGADGLFTYTPNADFAGIDTFTYKANDTWDDSNISTVTITVNAVNDVPVAVDDAYNVDEDQILSISAPGVIANDSDVDDDPLSVSLVVGIEPAHGALTLHADGSFTYTPTANYYGSDGFVYELSDGQDGTAQASVTLTVNSVNDAPLADDDSAITDEDIAVVIDVLDGDTDVDLDGLVVDAVTQGAHGTVVHDGSSVTYTPDANFHGPDSFTYTVSDGQGGTDVATVNVDVASVNDGPVAVDDSTTTDEDVAATIDVLVNDTDVEGDSLSVTAVGAPSHGTAVINPDDTITYTPDTGFSGEDSFSYTVDDGNGGTAQGTVSIQVTAATSNAIYVYDIRFESRYWGWQRRAVFEIRSDSDGDGQGTSADQVAAGVTITVEFAGQTFTGTTDASGVFRTSWLSRPASGSYAEVHDLVLANYDWDPLAMDLEDDSDGDGRPDAVL